jgi:hypothetical protein
LALPAFPAGRFALPAFPAGRFAFALPAPPFTAAFPGVGRYVGADFAATTPLPENSPGLVVAAIGGLPWLVEANSARFELAAF